MYNSRYNRNTSSSQLHISRNYNSQLTQEKQIEELQQKVDIILIHNNKLIEENSELRRLLDARNNNQSTDIYQLTSTIQELRKELSGKDSDLEQLRIALHEEIQALTKQLITVKQSEETLKTENIKLKTQNADLQHKSQKKLNEMISEVRNQMYENALQKQSEYHQELADKEALHKQDINNIKEQHRQALAASEEDKANKLKAIADKYQKENQEIRKCLEKDFEKRLKEIEKNANERCRKARENSQNYIKSILASHKETKDQTQDSLKKQIENLKDSLKSRQVLIEELLRNQQKNTENDYNRYYQQAQELRARIKQITQHFFKQSQLLKVKMAIKHEADVRQVSKAYESRIDVLSQKLNYFQIQNERLRKKVEEEIRGKMNLRNKFELQASKFKNIIRKMKIQLESYGKEMRLNIDGMKSQANSFSMSIIGSFEQEKVKKGFYEEELKKLQDIIDLKNSEFQTLTSQCQQKIRYFSEKCQSYKKKIKQYESVIDEQEAIFKKEMGSQKQADRRELEETNEHYSKSIEHLEELIKEERQKNDELSEKITDAKAEASVLNKEIKDKEHQIESLKAHIEAIKLQVEMMEHKVDTQAAIRPLKVHYERIISQIKQDKENLQATNSVQADQMARLIAKYKALEISMQKTLSTLQKRRDLDQRVIEIGTDNNLVKNLAEIFRRNEQQE